MKSIAAALVKAQKERNAWEESRLLKKVAQSIWPLKKVNQNSVLPMPQRFFEKVIFGVSDCWTWRASVDALGYGRFPYLGESKAHRVSYRLFKGEIPEGMCVMHTCDNRQCVNPEHLVLGTQADNVLDMCRKGRHVCKPQHGESNPMSKLTAQDVEEIRTAVESGSTQRAMCQKFGVSPMTVSRIIRKETWK